MEKKQRLWLFYREVRLRTYCCWFVPLFLMAKFNYIFRLRSKALVERDNMIDWNGREGPFKGVGSWKSRGNKRSPALYAYLYHSTIMLHFDQVSVHLLPSPLECNLFAGKYHVLFFFCTNFYEWIKGISSETGRMKNVVKIQKHIKVRRKLKSRVQ